MSRATTAACTTPTLSYIAEQSCILSFPLHPILLACSSVSGACHLHLQFAKKKRRKNSFIYSKDSSSPPVRTTTTKPTHLFVISFFFSAVEEEKIFSSF